MKPLHEVAHLPNVKLLLTDGNGAAFRVRINSLWLLKVIASDGYGWDHVSVSCEGRCPTWGEMELIKRLFFKEDETAMQLHVPPQDHVNCHPYCLHLWRPQDAEIPRPPSELVGPK